MYHKSRSSLVCLRPGRLAVAAVFSCLFPLVAAQAQPAPQIQEVVIIFKQHFDIGYTDMAVNVVQKYRTSMIDLALDVADQNKDLPPEQQFAWTIPGWPMHKIIEDWPGQSPERQRRILDAFKTGRFVVHALPFTTHTETLELEDLVRGMTFSSQLSRRVGLPLARDAKMTDVPSHTWSMATLLKHAGVEFLHIGCNQASSSPHLPPLFWWEGPDGSRLLTMYTAKGYGTGMEPPKDWPYRAFLALIHTGDNHGPPKPEEVKARLAEAKQKFPGAKVRVGRLGDFAKAVLANNPEIPVVRGDMPDSWIHGPMCDPAGAKLARQIRPAIAGAQSLNTLLLAWGIKTPDATGTIAKAYEQSLLYGEHTWGGSFAWPRPFWGYGEVFRRHRADGKYERLEESWEEHTGYIRAARDLIRPVIDQDLQAMAKAVNTAGPRVVVYNPLPWKRSAMAAVEVKANIPALRPADGNRSVPTQFDGQILRFFALDVPAMGYRTFVPAESASAPSATANSQAVTLESPFFKATLDPKRGVVVSLMDKRTGRELVDVNAGYGLGQYLYERFNRDQTEGFRKTYTKIDIDWARTEFAKMNLPEAREAPYQAASPVGFELKSEETPLCLQTEMRAPAGNGVPNGVTTRLTLYREQPYADLEIIVHDKPADTWPEAGWICLPFKVDGPQFRLGRLGSIIDPVKDVIRGSNRHLFTLNTGLTITGSDGQGVGLCPLDHPIVSLDTPGCWKYSLDFLPKKPVVFVNLFNNQWTTNFRMWNEGTWRSRVRIWSVDKADAEAGLITPSLEARQPLQAAWADGPAGKLPPTQTGVELSRKGILVTAFGKNPDGEGIILRLWEQAGKGGPCEVRLPNGLQVNTVQPVDLRGEPKGESIPVKDGVFTIEVGAFAPASVRIDVPAK